MFTRSRSGNSYRTSSEIFIGGLHGVGPRDSRGLLVDLSDRPLSCISSNLRNEIVVGGTDHALYSISLASSSGAVQPVTMYPKDSGHQDWVTTVAHLPNGLVLSGAMDGKVCIWGVSNRRNCFEAYPSQPQKPVDNGSAHSESGNMGAAYASLAASSTSSSSVIPSSSRKVISVGGASVEAYPVSKILSDTRYNVAISLTYGGMVDVWKFDDDLNLLQKHGSPVPVSSGSFFSRQGASSFASTAGSSSSILEGQFIKNNLAIADKAGSLTLVDLQQMRSKSRFRAHPGPITSLTFLDPDGDIIATGGNDGYVKVWDPRLSGSGLAFKIPAHLSPPPQAKSSSPYSSTGPRSSVSSSLVRKTRAPPGPITSNRGTPGPSDVKGAPVSILNPFLSSSGSGSMFNHLISCGGNQHDSRVLVHDLRMSASSYTSSASGSGSVPDLSCVVYASSHHSNGIYSSCIVGNDLFFVGDGKGMVMAHRLSLSGGEEQYNNCYTHYLNSQSEGKDSGFRKGGGEILYGLGSSSKGAVRGIECVNGKLVTVNEDGNVMIFDY